MLSFLLLSLPLLPPPSDRSQKNAEYNRKDLYGKGSSYGMNLLCKLLGMLYSKFFQKKQKQNM